ncbi:hypothetical protein Tsubulata_047369 [Turnera subulata]|uniref:Uncharacterized protein n=1 Tax=Turnera subulata TaxID=218843 RepID=A0A9Q0FFL0_9ROSI|nr:hypothetical protein Tsubulata_047369 [Turnera subulata]
MPSLSPPVAPSFSTTILFLILTLPHQHTHTDTVLSLLPSSSAAVLSLLPSFSANVLSLLPLRERLKWCCRVEGVNHLQKCRHPPSPPATSAAKRGDSGSTDSSKSVLDSEFPMMIVARF